MTLECAMIDIVCITVCKLYCLLISDEWSIIGVCFNDIRSVDVGYYLNANDITVGEGASSDYCFKVLIIGDSCKCLLFSCLDFVTLPQTFGYQSRQWQIKHTPSIKLYANDIQAIPW